MANDHLKHGGTNSIYGTRNVTNRLNAARVLHFKDATARNEYDLEFGEPSLKESVMSVLSNSARNIALMQELGTNPRDTFEKVLALLRKEFPSCEIESISVKFHDSVDETTASKKIAEDLVTSENIHKINQLDDEELSEDVFELPPLSE